MLMRIQSHAIYLVCRKGKHIVLDDNAVANVSNARTTGDRERELDWAAMTC